LAQVPDRFKLEVAAEIVFVRLSSLVRERRESAGDQHFHHHQGAGPRQPCYDRDKAAIGARWAFFGEMRHGTGV